LSAPDTAKSVQEKVDTILALFYRWPELCAEVMNHICNRIILLFACMFVAYHVVHVGVGLRGSSR